MKLHFVFYIICSNTIWYPFCFVFENGINPCGVKIYTYDYGLVQYSTLSLFIYVVVFALNKLVLLEPNQRDPWIKIHHWKVCYLQFCVNSLYFVYGTSPVICPKGSWLSGWNCRQDSDLSHLSLPLFSYMDWHRENSSCRLSAWITHGLAPGWKLKHVWDNIQITCKSTTEHIYVPITTNDGYGTLHVCRLY